MKNQYLWIKDRLFNESLDFRAQIFNAIGLIAVFTALMFTIFNIRVSLGVFNVFANLWAAVFAFLILWHVNKTKKYELYNLLIIIVVFIFLFPVIFFLSGGYRSGVPSFFVFALVYTALVQRGKQRIIFMAVEFVLYDICLIIAYSYPETVVSYGTETEMEFDVIVGCLFTAVALVTAISRYIAIYERRLSELEIVINKQQDINRAKNEFLQYVSHELRTPVTVLTNYARDSVNELAKPVLDIPEINYNQNRIIAEGEHLKRMVSQLLDITAIEDGRLTIIKTPVSLADIITRTAVAYNEVIDQSGNRLLLDIPDGLQEVEADCDVIEQILYNFLTNAAKHTKKGTITVSLSESDGKQKVRVSDTGEGINPNLINKIFYRFVDYEKLPDKNGLGLYICKKYINAHGGDIDIYSEQGKGTDIWFSLPV